MKHTILYIATLFLLAACQQEELPLGAQALGYLSLSAVEVEASDVQLISTRAGETDDLIVALTPEDGTTKEYKYAETISCPPGTYTLEIYNKAYKDKADAAQHYYKHTKQVVIEEGKTTTIEEQEQDQEQPIQVPMINFGVTFTANIAYFTDYSFSVTYNSTTRNIGTGETAYFDISDKATPLSYTLSAKNEDNEDVETSGSYGEGTEESINDGTIYTVTYSLATKSLQVEK
ncbi:hypothetical protein B5F77_01120 [Parabacteroides sp. An277]|uniref:DUF4493 domain-containing protein n=1 Tax=Parabacteroides sp. An277 TaxID=1965619 RepID=UPI000B371F74|nr:DUF4493 domain-containing protein [Parabacteroides sp. An277]OUO55486.1 hypothetical protein B5F77_01120 [Parabacteroides sp. An277]